MAQPDAERIMGLLAQSETFRIAFAKDPVGALSTEGVKLTDADKKALKAIDFSKASDAAVSGGYCCVH